MLKISETDMYAEIHVIDEGKGITEEEAARIFGRFFRGEEVQQEGRSWNRTLPDQGDSFQGRRIYQGCSKQ